MKEYKYFIHNDDDSVICTHPLVKAVSVIRNYDAPANAQYTLPMCQLKIIINHEKPNIFGGQYLASCLEVADNYLKNVFPFDYFSIQYEGTTINFIEKNDGLVRITASSGDKHFYHSMRISEFVSLLTTCSNNIASSEPFGDVKSLTEVFFDKLKE